MSLRRFFPSTIRQVGGVVLPLAVNSFSTRLVNPNYTGHCMAVMRTSDNTVQNIGFTDGIIDETALSAFVGSGSGFVQTWFNQFGDNHFNQTNTARQPRIVLNGVIERLNGKACINFFQRTLNFTTSSLWLRDDVVNSYITYVGETSLTAAQILLASVSSIVYGLRSLKDSTDTIINSGWIDDPQPSEPERKYFIVRDAILQNMPANQGEVYNILDGRHIISECNCGTTTTSWLGARTGSLSYIGKIAELAVHTSDKITPLSTTDIQNIQSEINSFYSVW